MAPVATPRLAIFGTPPRFLHWHGEVIVPFFTLWMRS